MRIRGRVATIAMTILVAAAAGKPVTAALGGGAGRAGELAPVAESIWSEYQCFAGARAPIPRVTVHSDPAAFAAAARKGVPNAPWAAGFYARGQVHVKKQATARDNALLLRHELAHALLDGRSRVPLWFNEGFATYMETRTVTPGGAEAIARAYSRTAVTLLAFHTGQGAQVRTQYAGARLAVEYLVATRGEESLQALVRRLRAGEPFDRAFRAVYGLTAADLQSELTKGAARRPMA